MHNYGHTSYLLCPRGLLVFVSIAWCFVFVCLFSLVACLALVPSLPLHLGTTWCVRLVSRRALTFLTSRCLYLSSCCLLMRGLFLSFFLLLVVWDTHKSLPPATCIFASCFWDARLKYTFSWLQLFSFVPYVSIFANLAKQRRKKFQGVSEVGKKDFSAYFFRCCVFFLFGILLCDRSGRPSGGGHTTMHSF